ncbi:MAG TPA: branched-chain amino acid ABC transporter permease [Ferrovibrio sp.]|uniref:branched-chain amino acid ABC transporter permease n=1 Tax=Ferrovibrio sp. TaxID=1917215 RepID=UPI002ECFD92A
MFYRESGQYKTSYSADQAIFTIPQDRVFFALLMLVAFIGVPLVATDYIYTALLIPFLCLSLAALGLNILTGYCGQLSLGTGAFMGVGAVSAWNLAYRLPDLNLLVVFVLAGLITAVVGIFFGLPSMRIKGFYLAVATLAAQFFLPWLFVKWGWLTNYNSSGVISVPELRLFGWGIDTPMEKYLFALAVVAVLALMAKNMVRSNPGRQWMAIRDMDIAAEIIGIRPMVAKLSAFAVSSFFVGVAGALYLFVYLGSTEPDGFGINLSFQTLFMVIIGGLGSIMGSFLGAFFILLLPIFLTQVPPALGFEFSTALVSHLEFMVFGALIVFFLIVEPHGLARLWQIAKEKLRIWPFPY